MMIFGTLFFFQWQTVHLDFPNAAKKQSRPADTGAHENPHTAVKNKECWDTPRVNKADTAITITFGKNREKLLSNIAVIILIYCSYYQRTCLLLFKKLLSIIYTSEVIIW